MTEGKIRYFTEKSSIEEQALTQIQNTASLPLRKYDILKVDFEADYGMDCHHNFAQFEHHHGENLLITRKGAIQAKAGQEGFIPGSMGDNSFLVSGLGFEHSYNSAPHGAGRKMSRGEARRTFSEEQLKARMEGIEARLRPQIVDEHPGAYKDIHCVLREASNLVKPTTKLTQLINIKGD